MKNFDFIFRNKKVCFDRLPAFGFRQDAIGPCTEESAQMLQIRSVVVAFPIQ